MFSFCKGEGTMLSRTQPYSMGTSGDTHAGLFEDISTSALQTVRIGGSAGKVATGPGNVYAGYECGKMSVLSSYTTAIGYQAMYASTNSTYGTAVGAYAAAQNTSGSETVYVGYRCGELSSSGNQVTAVGAYSMRENVAANASTAIGYRSAERTLDGGFCVFIGAMSGQDNRSSYYSTMAGYQSGRASRGNENCYFGAYSGYSNLSGNGSCLFGMRSGENTAGDYNCAFGAYCMQNAAGSCNVAIGAFANSDGVGSAEAVFIGANVAGKGTASQSVVIGTNAGSTANGSGLVILGYNAGTGFMYGNCNIIIGQGATTYSASNDNCISIGSINTKTATNSISVGNNITNHRQRSILVGFGLDCDANQSVILGNTISIQSVSIFQDPLSEPYIGSVLLDGSAKIGLVDVGYCNMLVSPSPYNTVYTSAQASILGSNLVNTETNPPDLGTGTTSYNLLAIGDTFVVPGAFYSIRTASDSNGVIDSTSLVPLTSIPSSDIIASGAVGGAGVRLSDMLTTDSIYESYSFPNYSNTTVNIRLFDQSNATASVYVAKQLARPVLHGNANSNTIGDYTASSMFQCNIPFAWMYSNIGFESTGLVLPTSISTTSSAITRMPVYGVLDPITNVYTPYIESAFATQDSFDITPVVNVTAGQTGGVPGSNATTFHVLFNSCNQTYFTDSIKYPNYGSVTYINSNIVRCISGNASGLHNNVYISHIDSSLYLSSNGVTFSSSDVSTMTSEQISNYPDSQYPYYYQQLINISLACVSSNIAFSNTVLQPLIANMEGALSSIQTQVVSDVSTIEYGLFNDLNTAFNVFSSNQSPDTLASMSNIYNILVNYVQNNQGYVFGDGPTFDSNLALYYANYIDNQYNVMTSNLSVVVGDFQTGVGLSNIWSYISLNQAVFAGFDYTSNMAASVYNIYHKYYEVPRLFLTYADIVASHVFVGVSSNIYGWTPGAYIEISTNSKDASIPLYTTSPSTVWNINNIGYTYTIPTSCNLLYNIPLYIPTSASNVYIQEMPSQGILIDSGSWAYKSINPWQQNGLIDSIDVVLTSNMYSVNADYAFQYDNNVRATPVIYIQSPSTVYNVINTYLSTCNVLVDSIPLCNVDIVKSYTLNGVAQPQMYTTNYSLINYDPSVGYWTNTSNIVVHTSSTSSNVGANAGTITYGSNYTSILTITGSGALGLDVVNQVTTTSNIVTVPWIDVNMSNIAITYSYNWSNTVLQTYSFAFDIEVSYVVENITNNSAFDNITGEYVYSYVVSNITVPVMIGCNVQPSYGMIQNVTSNIINNSNVVVETPVCKLNRSSLWNKDPQFVFSGGSAIMSNIGHVTSWTMQEILDGQVYFNTSSYWEMSTRSVGVYISIAHSVLDMTLPMELITIDPALQTGSIQSLINAALLKVAGITPANLHLYSVNRGAIVVNSTLETVIGSHDWPNAYYLATGRYNSDILQFYFTDATFQNASQRFEVSIELNQSPVPYGQSWNTGLSYINPNALSLNSNAFYCSYNGVLDCNLYVDVTGLSSGISSISSQHFSIQQVIDGTIFVEPAAGSGAVDSGVITFDIYDQTLGTSLTPVITGLIFPVTWYNYESYPLIQDCANGESVLRMLGIDNVSYSNQLVGKFWDKIQKYNVLGNAINPSDITLSVSAYCINGFLFNTRDATVPSLISYADLLNNTLRYIPYNPDLASLSNDSFQFQLMYSGTTSPVYSMNIQNYISRFAGSSLINTGSYSVIPRTIVNPLYSYGMTYDSVAWSNVSGNTVISQSNSPMGSVTLNWSLVGVSGIEYVQNVHTYSYSTQITLNSGEPLQLVVDQADSVSLQPVLEYISCNVDTVANSYMYIITQPVHGIVVNIVTGERVIRCLEEDVRNDNIVYQHFGTIDTSDSFMIGFSTTPYDLTSSSLTVDININEMPMLSKNKVSYIYADTSNYAVNNVYSIGSNMTYDPSYLHIVNTSNIIPTSNIFDVGVVPTFNVSPTLLEDSNSSNGYIPMGFDFALNNQSTSHVNSLAAFTPYRSLFINHTEVILNKHIDSNIRLPGQSDLQSIVYTIDCNVQSLINVPDHTTTISLQVWPIPSLTQSQTSFLYNNDFIFSMYDNNGLIMQAEFTKNTYIFTFASSNGIMTGTLPSQMSIGTWNTLQIINNDPANNNELSVYWVDGTNLLAGASVTSFTTQSLSQFRIDVPTTAAYNFIASSNFVAPLNDVFVSYDLLNTYTTQRFENFEVTVTTYAVSDTSVDTTVNNVVVGNSLTVRGVNNIAIGNTFSTSGSKSIIIGNNIGTTSTGVNNDIYQSIIIGNTSFNNSIVRDIICIGRNNLNDMELVDVAKVQNFLSLNPVIIGNSISSNTLDFHINIDNTFLKTSQYTSSTQSQIYLGISQEPVGIGYASNSHISPYYPLHVNGPIEALHITAGVSMLGVLTGTGMGAGFLVSSTGDWNSLYDLPIVSICGRVGSGIVDSNVLGVYLDTNSAGNIVIGIGGTSKVWCDTAVSSGQLLQPSVNYIGVASPSASPTKNNGTFAKAICNWDGSTATGITTSNIYGVVMGLVPCLLNC
jgi:hypothetical protein